MPVTTSMNENENFAAHEAIAAVLADYIDAARGGDGQLMRRAFRGSASIHGHYGGKPIDWTLQAFCEIIDKGGPAPDLRPRIVAMDVAGTAASARLEAENWRGTRYTDLFLLTASNGAWKIVHKAFFAHSRG